MNEIIGLMGHMKVVMQKKKNQKPNKQLYLYNVWKLNHQNIKMIGTIIKYRILALKIKGLFL